METKAIEGDEARAGYVLRDEVAELVGRRRFALILAAEEPAKLGAEIHSNLDDTELLHLTESVRVHLDHARIEKGQPVETFLSEGDILRTRVSDFLELLADSREGLVMLVGDKFAAISFTPEGWSLSRIGSHGVAEARDGAQFIVSHLAKILRQFMPPALRAQADAAAAKLAAEGR